MRSLRVARRMMTGIALVVAQVAAAQQSSPPVALRDAPRVITSASGEARVVPDRATIAIGVSTRGRTAAQASADNARRQRAVIDTLRAMGISNEDYSTSDFSVFPEEVMNPARSDTVPRVLAYRVSNTIRVEVRKLEQIGSLLDAALAKGANGVNSLQFFSSRADSGRRVALAAAAQRARGDAEALACAVGGHLGELIEMSTSPVYSPRPSMMMREAGMAGGGTPINPGEQSMNVSVVAQWSLVSGVGTCSKH